ncbi:MAG: hypothetical protein K0B52_06370, partial [FCB group bacterium]|nr:hypothetical protein [FCB group bacterium]
GTMKKIIFIAIIAGSLLNLLSAADEAGGRAGAYLRMPGDARSASMGNGLAAVSGDANLAGVNPAILPFLESKQFSTSFQFLTLDRSHQTLSFGLGLPPNAGMCISWVHAGVNKITGRNYSNDPTYEYSWSQDAFVMAFGMNVIKQLSIGVSAKILSDRLGYSSSSGFSADIGILLEPFDDLKFGFVVKDITGKVTWDISSEPFVDFQTRRVDTYPLVYHLGISYYFLDRYLISGTYKMSNDIEPSWHIGAEARVWEAFYIRAGADNGTPVFGFGTSYKLRNDMSTRLDYAFITGRVQEGISHMFTWLFYF